jgi:hypothetical protein
VMLRLDQGGSNADSTRFFGNLISQGYNRYGVRCVIPS